MPPITITGNGELINYHIHFSNFTEKTTLHSLSIDQNNNQHMKCCKSANEMKTIVHENISACAFFKNRKE